MDTQSVRDAHEYVRRAANRPFACGQTGRQTLVSDATGFGQPTQSAVANRGGVARHSDKSTVQVAVHHLESVEPVKRANCNRRRHTERSREDADIQIGASRSRLDQSTQPTGHQGRSRPKKLRPHLLDIRIGKAPSIVGARRDGNHVQSDRSLIKVHVDDSH
jgi:hypothetical protein